MKTFAWDPDKNQLLIEERGVSFEDVIFFQKNNGLVDDASHPNKEKYPNQRVFFVNMDDYIYLVPYVESKDEIFLKTIIPGRKATKTILGGEK